ncbi:FAD-dependent oxidoreductase [Arthrobacter sp. D1-29]
MPFNTSARDETVDVIVLGTGAAGLTAAITATRLGRSVAIFEKEATVGGTTAVSGGVVWVPAHDRSSTGKDFSIDDALTYLAALSNGTMRDDLVQAFVRTGPRMLDFIEQATQLRFHPYEGFPDYKPEKPGGRPAGGRSFNPAPFNFAELGDWASAVTAFPADWSDVGFDAETMARVGQSAAEFGFDDNANVKFMGKALIGGLLKGLLDAGVVPRVNSPATELIVTDGHATGVVVNGPDGARTVHARNGVVLATGGFEWNPELVGAFLRGPMLAPVSPPGKNGDGLRMAMKAGAALGNMSEAWWATGIRIPGDTIDGHPRSRSIRSERTHPRCIIVNASGRRFANEAQDYNSMGGAFHQIDPSDFSFPNTRAWMVFDEQHLQTYGFLGVKPGEIPPEWFSRSASITELGERCGIDTAGLSSTIDRWNTAVTTHQSDPDFRRGSSAYDSFWGDLSKPVGPERTLGPIDSGPYYAVPIYVGTIGTKGGPATDENGQVRNVDGALIGGLYAAGNAMANALGMAYPGAGATIGTAMVFGYRAGHHAATGAGATMNM